MWERRRCWGGGGNEWIGRVFESGQRGGVAKEWYIGFFSVSSRRGFIAMDNSGFLAFFFIVFLSRSNAELPQNWSIRREASLQTCTPIHAVNDSSTRFYYFIYDCQWRIQHPSNFSLHTKLLVWQESFTRPFVDGSLCFGIVLSVYYKLNLDQTTEGWLLLLNRALSASIDLEYLILAVNGSKEDFQGFLPFHEDKISFRCSRYTSGEGLTNDLTLCGQ